MSNGTVTGSCHNGTCNGAIDHNDRSMYKDGYSPSDVTTRYKHYHVDYLNCGYNRQAVNTFYRKHCEGYRQKLNENNKKHRHKDRITKNMNAFIKNHQPQELLFGVGDANSNIPQKEVFQMICGSCEEFRETLEDYEHLHFISYDVHLNEVPAGSHLLWVGVDDNGNPNMNNALKADNVPTPFEWACNELGYDAQDFLVLKNEKNYIPASDALNEVSQFLTSRGYNVCKYSKNKDMFYLNKRNNSRLSYFTNEVIRPILHNKIREFDYEVDTVKDGRRHMNQKDYVAYKTGLERTKETKKEYEEKTQQVKQEKQQLEKELKEHVQIYKDTQKDINSLNATKNKNDVILDEQYKEYETAWHKVDEQEDEIKITKTQIEALNEMKEEKEKVIASNNQMINSLQDEINAQVKENEELETSINKKANAIANNEKILEEKRKEKKNYEQQINAQVEEDATLDNEILKLKKQTQDLPEKQKIKQQKQAELNQLKQKKVSYNSVKREIEELDKKIEEERQKNEDNYWDEIEENAQLQQKQNSMFELVEDTQKMINNIGKLRVKQSKIDKCLQLAKPAVNNLKKMYNELAREHTLEVEKQRKLNEAIQQSVESLAEQAASIRGNAGKNDTQFGD